MSPRWTMIADRTATAIYRAAFSGACGFFAIELLDLLVGDVTHMPQYRVEGWDRMAAAIILITVTAGLRWTVRGARGFGKGEP